MQLSLLAVGKLKSGAEEALCADYETRINQLARRGGIKGLRCTEFPESRATQAMARKEEEAQRLLSAMPQDAISVAFDEHGKSLASAEFSSLIATAAGQAAPHMCFLIGGPDGHGAPLLARATHRLALGRMTWPHRLARILVLEQIYRAITIMTNHPYHRP